MKIWVIGRGYPTTSNRMWGSFELEQAKLLAREENEVSYISLTLSFFDRKDPRGLRQFEEDNVKIYAYSRLYFPGKLGIYWEKFEDKCWKKLFDVVYANTGLPDLIHIHYPSMISSIHEVEEYRKKGVKIFVTEHWSRVLLNHLKSHEKARLDYYATHSKCFLSVGRPLQESVDRLSDVTVPMDVVPNVVSPLFHPDDHPYADEKFTFVMVGRLVPLKQFDVVIREFIREFAGNDEVRLAVIGAGKEKDRLVKISSTVKSQVIFTGPLRLEEVAEKIKAANALISYSKYETFGVPIIEAWACGKPVIVSDRVGAVSYVNEERGLVVPFDEPSELGKAMHRMIAQYDTYNHRGIAEFAQENFSDRAIYQKLHKIYESC